MSPIMRSVQFDVSGRIAPPFLTLALCAGEWSALYGRFTSGEKATCTHWIESWVSPRTGLDTAEKRTLVTCRESNPSRPAHSYIDWAMPTPNYCPMERIFLTSHFLPVRSGFIYTHKSASKAAAFAQRQIRMKSRTRHYTIRRLVCGAPYHEIG
jgi:hypothetical protein